MKAKILITDPLALLISGEFMKNLRKVEYTLRTYADGKYHEVTHQGLFHIWGHRGDESGTDFFGVVEASDGSCLELDAAQIKFVVIK